MAQVFSCELYEIYKNTFFHRTPLVSASGLCFRFIVPSCLLSFQALIQTNPNITLWKRIAFFEFTYFPMLIFNLHFILRKKTIDQPFLSLWCCASLVFINSIIKREISLFLRWCKINLMPHMDVNLIPHMGNKK